MGNNSDEMLYCLLGNGIKNSLSPIIQNSFFQSNNLEGYYTTLNVNSNDLEIILDTLSKLNFRGANVTIPHKTNIIPYLDSLDPLASSVNAVNTILFENEELIGYNTDVEGFMNPLLNQIQQFNNKKVVILGSGGASKAVLYGLLNENCKEIIILNRTIENTRKLVSKLNSNTSISFHELNQKNIDSLSNIDIMINTVPLHKTNTIFNFHPNLGIKLAYDLEYIPKETNFIKQMQSLNANVIYGYEMLLAQARLSFQIWTGILPDDNSINDKVLSVLGN
ncbi:MAG: shikimate dehydrogenase [Thaumarchaeota archaeon]|nr:shikimate dehydrogenase [Nitrososphaerota archaeon]|tara:strand:+ start:65133 stop:65969 length:837 start_codon:yes stop_codon:yes gene_type:complete